MPRVLRDRKGPNTMGRAARERKGSVEVMKANVHCECCWGKGRVPDRSKPPYIICDDCCGTGRLPIGDSEVFKEGRGYSLRRWREFYPGAIGR